jgi:hypothetical protein
MRLMSFSSTTPQILARTKSVTRRMGWQFLKPGDLVQAVEKGQGLKKGEHVKRLAVLRIVDVRREPLFLADKGECRLEGFPDLSPYDFAEFFCQSHKPCTHETVVTRIAFEFVDADERKREAHGDDADD